MCVCVYYFYFELILSTNCVFRMTCLSHGRQNPSSKNTECVHIRQEHVAAQNTKTMFLGDMGCCPCDRILSPKNTETEFRRHKPIAQATTLSPKNIETVFMRCELVARGTGLSLKTAGTVFVR